MLLGWIGGHASLVMVADESGQMLFANDAACAWRGRDRQQVLQERIQDIDDALWREWSDPDHPRWQPGRFSEWQSWRETEDGRRVATSFRLQALALREQRFLMLVSGELYPREDVEQQRAPAIVQGADLSRVETGLLKSGGRSLARESRDMNELTSLQGMHVLVVDDNEINRELATSILASHGATALTANDGQAAVKMLEGGASVCDIVLMDLQMPGMDGIQTTAQMRQLPGYERLPIVALTASAFNEQRVAALRAGMDAVVTKPFDVSGLVRLLLQLVRGVAGGDGRATDNSSARSPAAPTRAPLLVDFDAGLALWQDAEQYRRHLLRFVKEHEDEAQRASTLGNEDLILLVHKTRGSAAALALVAVAEAANQLEAHLRSDARDLEEIARFGAEIGRTCLAINEYLDASGAD
ncbi:MAG TPA: response regulator [Hydrogenophaga sp.]|nr:response regulator [Hydrogenophaga sp.]